MGSWVDRTCGKAAVGGLGWARQWLADPVRWWLVEWVVPQSCVDKLGGNWGARQIMQPRAPTRGNKASNL